MILGAALTEAESNGVNDNADWADWIDRGRAPDAGTGNNSDLNTLEDLGLLKTLGVGELMVTLEWARLEPSPGKYDQAQVLHYQLLLDQIQEHEIEPWVCLIDGTMPGWFAVDDGGFDDTRSRTKTWPRHVDWIGETFHSQVSGWVAQREPVRRAVRSHLLGTAPPGKRSAADTGTAVANALLAENEAWRILQGSAPVALFHTLQSFHPEPDNVKAKPEAAWLDTLFNQTLRHALTDGVIDIPDGPRHQADSFRDAFNRLIFQARPPIQIDGDGGWSLLRAPLVEAHAEAISHALELAGERDSIIAGDLALFSSTEFGATEPDRADGLAEMLELTQSVGATGWWQASPIDGWHWEHGFGIDPGLANQNRELRPAAEVLPGFAP